MVYVPSMWWHEVSTDDDEEGLSMGVNYFFDPFFIRRRAQKQVYLHESRMYYHIKAGPDQLATPCTEKYVCLIDETLDKSSDKKERRSRGSGRGNPNRKLKDEHSSTKPQKGTKKKRRRERN